MTSPRRTRNRNIAKLIGASLLFGMVMSVAVAWAVAWRTSPYRADWTERMTVDEYGIVVGVCRSSFGLRANVVWTAPQVKARNLRGDGESATARAPIPRWVFQPSGQSGETGLTRLLSTFGYGWPAVSMRGVIDESIDYDVLSSSERRGWYPLNGEGTASDPFRALPLLPYWRGLLANAAFYAASVCVPGLGFVTLRRRWRRRRGLCMACGYDLTGITNGPCPECGTA